MTNFDWAKLGVKLIGLWLMISNLRLVTNVVEAILINRSRSVAFAIAPLLSPLLTGLAGLYLWLRSDRLASSIFPTVSAVESSVADDMEPLLALALCLMGIWLVSDAIPTLVYNILVSIFTVVPVRQSVFDPVYPAPVMTVTQKANIISALVRAFIGIGLLLGSRRLAEVIAVLRGRRDA